MCVYFCSGSYCDLVIMVKLYRLMTEPVHIQMSAAKRVCNREMVPKSFVTYELPKDKVIESEFVIKNFAATQSQLDTKVKSPIFPQVDGLPKWCITVYPRGDDAEKFKFKVEVALEKARLGKTSEVVDVKVQFLNDNRRVIVESYATSKDVSKGRALFYDIKTATSTAIPISDSGDLIVSVEITMKGSEPIVVIETANDICIAQSTFPRNFSSVLESGNFSDFTVISSDKREFPVHKLILAMRVPHFERMFKSDMSEVEKKRVEVDFSGDCVEAMLEYVYKDEMAKLSEVVVELLQLAHQYEMDRLMSICVAEMVKNLDGENLYESLKVAKLLSIVPLRSACEKFIADHPTMAAEAMLKVNDIS